MSTSVLPSPWGHLQAVSASCACKSMEAMRSGHQVQACGCVLWLVCSLQIPNYVLQSGKRERDCMVILCGEVNVIVAVSTVANKSTLWITPRHPTFFTEAVKGCWSTFPAESHELHNDSSQFKSRKSSRMGKRKQIYGAVSTKLLASFRRETETKLLLCPVQAVATSIQNFVVVLLTMLHSSNVDAVRLVFWGPCIPVVHF